MKHLPDWACTAIVMVLYFVLGMMLLEFGIVPVEGYSF